MNFQSHFLVTYLLLLFFSPRGFMEEGNIVWGVRTQSISLDIPDFPKDQDIDDIRWYKGPTLIIKLKQQQSSNSNPNYEIFTNGTLKIKELQEESEQKYTVAVFHKDGKNLLEKVFTLHVIEAVSKPEMTWDCTQRSVTCEIQNGTDAELTLLVNGTSLKKGIIKNERLTLKYSWNDLPILEFKCVAKNQVSEKMTEGQPPCTGKVLNIYHILSICAGGVILLIFLTLIISCFLRRKKQNAKTNDQNLETNSSRVKMEERGRKYHHCPVQNPQVSGGRHPQQPGGHRPLAPGHRLQVPSHGPPVPGHRPQPQQKRPSPRGQPQTGPPLPRPRNQQRPPQQEKEK